MPKPNMPSIPGADAMAGTLEMVKALWSGMGIPGMMMPSVSADDINKQIADLKAVESWLTLNMNMLRNTIQALEVQSATISNLHSMKEAMSAMAAKSEAFSANPFAAGFSSAEDTERKAANGKAQGGKRANEKSGAEPGAHEQADFSFMPPTAEKPPAPQVSESAASSDASSASSSSVGNMAAMAAPFGNPAAWWNMLQDQFKQAVETATASDASAKPAVKRQAGAQSVPKSAVAKAATGKGAHRSRAAANTETDGKTKKAAKPNTISKGGRNSTAR